MTSTPATQKVLVLGYARAGGSILRALGRRSAQFSTSLLVRPATDVTKKVELASFQALGVALVEGNLHGSEAELACLFSGFHTVVSCISHFRTGTDEMRLVRACKAAGVQRYMPTAWGVDERAIGRGSPMAVVLDKKLDFYEALPSAGVPFTALSTGFWMEWLFGGGGGDSLGIDWQRRVFTAVGSMDCRPSTTSLRDLGELTAEILLDPATLNQHVRVQSELVTLEQLVAALERATGLTFKRDVYTIGEAEAAQAAEPHNFKWTSRILVARERGLWWPKEESWNSPDRQLSFKLHSVQEVAEQVVEEKKSEQAKQADPHA